MKKTILTIALILISGYVMSQKLNEKYITDNECIKKVITYDSNYMIDHIDSVIVVYLQSKTEFRKIEQRDYYISVDGSRQQYRVIGNKGRVAIFYNITDAKEYIRFKEWK